MGFPQDIRSLEGLNKLLDELEQQIEQEHLREQAQRCSDEIASTDDERAAAATGAAVLAPINPTVLAASEAAEAREQEQEQRLPLPVQMMTPRVEAALGNLIAQVYRSRPPLPEEPHARMAEILCRDAIRTHLVKVAVRSQSPAELRMRLIRDGTIPDEPVIEELPRWEWLSRSR